MQTLMKWLLRGLAALFALSALMGLFASITAGKDLGAGLIAAGISAALAAGLWYWSGSNDRAGARHSANVQRLVDETVRYFEAVNRDGRFPPAQTDRIISTPDREVLAACNAKLFELATQRSSQHVGTRLKLAGMPVYVGRSIPVSSTELREASPGELAVTPDMLIFSGPLKSADVALSRITSVEVMRDGITVTVTGRQRPITFQVANGLLWGQLVKNLMQVKVNGRQLPEGAQLRAM